MNIKRGMLSNFIFDKGLKQINHKSVSKHLDFIFDRIVLENISLVSVDRIIYQNNLLNELVSSNLSVDTNWYVCYIDNIINKLESKCNTKGVVKLLFDIKLKANYTKETFTFSDEDVQILKELIWITYYLSELRTIPLVKDLNLKEVLLILLDCNEEYLNNYSTSLNTIAIKFISNIISLKDSRLDLIPYPSAISPWVIVELLVRNYPQEVILLNLARSLCENKTNPNIRSYYIRLILENIRNLNKGK